MSHVRIQIRKEGVREILRSERVKADLERRAQAIAEKANGALVSGDSGFVVDSEIGRTRARAAVVTATAEAMQAEATNRTLTRSLDAGRG